MSANLDLDDVFSGHPVAQQELDQLRAENLALALQVKALKYALSGAKDSLWNYAANSAACNAEDVLSKTDNSTAIIAAHDAEVRKAALIEAAGIAKTSCEKSVHEDGEYACSCDEAITSAAKAIDSPAADIEVTK